MKWPFGVALVLAACGARSSLAESDPIVDTPIPDASAGDAGAGERHCLPNCTVGDECCIGGCDGPPADTFNGCCTCLPGEVSSFDCDGLCGG
jgi:hypothetical protein